MRLNKIITLAVLGLATLGFTACNIGTPDSTPAKVLMKNTTTLGEYESDTTIEIPHNFNGAVVSVQGPTLADHLENLSDLTEIVKTLSPEDQEEFLGLQQSDGYTRDVGESWLIDLFGKKGYVVYSPVLNKEHRAFSLTVIGGNFENDPEVISQAVALGVAISDNNKEAAIKAWDSLKELGVELGPQIIEQLFTPGL